MVNRGSIATLDMAYAIKLAKRITTQYSSKESLEVCISHLTAFQEIAMLGNVLLAQVHSIMGTYGIAEIPWREVAMVGLTRQYVAGILARFGLGLLVGTWLSWGWQPGLVLPRFLLIAVGASQARAEKQAGQPQRAAEPGAATDGKGM